jgi:hypothetical protein
VAPCGLLASSSSARRCPELRRRFRGADAIRNHEPSIPPLHVLITLGERRLGLIQCVGHPLIGRRNRRRSDCTGPSLRCGLGRAFCGVAGACPKLGTEGTKSSATDLPFGNLSSSVGLATHRDGPDGSHAPQRTIGQCLFFADM